MCRGALEILFEVHLAGPERLERFARRRLESRLELGLSRTRRMPLPPPPADALRSTG